MNIAIIGTGYVGLTTGTCMAELGHSVTAVDIDSAKITNLKKGNLPIYEPGLEELVKRNTKEQRLTFTTDTIAAIKNADVVFSAVGTPPDKDHKADLTAVFNVAKTFGQAIEKYTILVTKSTVPVGTNKEIKTMINNELQKRNQGIVSNLSSLISFDIVSNPEFLREGSAIHDTMYPDRIVVGSDSEKARNIMTRLYTPITSQNEEILFFTSIASAELIKYACNSFLATKISFMNEIANFCDLTGADVTDVAKAMGLDTRISPRFLHAGIGYGGSCFPKDVQALIQAGEEKNYNFSILKAVEERNRTQKEVMIKKVLQVYPDLRGKNIAVWGISFKPKTDDTRYAPSLEIIKKLLEQGATVTAYDPIASLEVWIDTSLNSKQKQQITIADSAYKATMNADALLLLTEWDEFRSPDFNRLKAEMEQPIIFDGRNIYDPNEVKANGFTYYDIGRAQQIQPTTSHRSIKQKMTYTVKTRIKESLPL